MTPLQKKHLEFMRGAEQEPVAIGWYIEGYGAVLGAVRPNLRYEEWRPFYAMRISPQRTWVGLTDAEADELWESTDSDDDWELMKRTEAKLRSKNENRMG